MVKCPFCGHETDFLTVTQVAQLLGMSEQNVRYKIKQGHFDGAITVAGITSAKMWRIPTTAVLPLLEANDASV
jgi:predicted DNA-binding transcriptional regulator AlpA